MKRIRRLLYPQVPSAAAWTSLAVTGILVITTAATLVAWQSTPTPNQSLAQPAVDVSSPYAKWLNEEVVYIIADNERAAFERLISDDERNLFIKQFWELRSARDADAKEKHYRRIAYANKQFQAPSGRPGWQSDRGHVYIVYGPPDELENHPTGRGQTAYPFEVWMYRHVEGIGDNLTITFVDRMRSGDYRLAPGNIR